MANDIVERRLKHNFHSCLSSRIPTESPGDYFDRSPGSFHSVLLVNTFHSVPWWRFGHWTNSVRVQTSMVHVPWRLDCHRWRFPNTIHQDLDETNTFHCIIDSLSNLSDRRFHRCACRHWVPRVWIRWIGIYYIRGLVIVYFGTRRSRNHIWIHSMIDWRISTGISSRQTGIDQQWLACGQWHEARYTCHWMPRTPHVHYPSIECEILSVSI